MKIIRIKNCYSIKIHLKLPLKDRITIRKIFKKDENKKIIKRKCYSLDHSHENVLKMKIINLQKSLE